jgi:hypothetical protein
MKGDPVNVLVLILVASFAIDRIVTGILFLLSFSSAWTRRFPEAALLDEGAARKQAEKKQKLIYFVLAGVLGIVMLAGFGNIRLLDALGVQPPKPAPDPDSPGFATSLFQWLDKILTGLILMGGAERISKVLKEHGLPGAEKPASRPIEITGKLILEDEAGKKIVAGSVGPPSIAA